jgi:hypothetical protein
VARARAAYADLFISLHADSLKDHKMRGATVYTLRENASDKEAEELAAKENKADIIIGMDLTAESSDVTNILIDLAQRETMNFSTRFANDLIPQFRGKVTLTPLCGFPRSQGAGCSVGVDRAWLFVEPPGRALHLVERGPAYDLRGHRQGRGRLLHRAASHGNRHNSDTIVGQRLTNWEIEIV